MCFWQDNGVFALPRAYGSWGNGSRRATTIHTPWFSPSSDSTPFRGFPTSARLCHRVILPQSVHLTALIFSLPFMKMSAYSRANGTSWRRPLQIALRGVVQSRTPVPTVPPCKHSSLGAQRSVCAQLFCTQTSRARRAFWGARRRTNTNTPWYEITHE